MLAPRLIMNHPKDFERDEQPPGGVEVEPKAFVVALASETKYGCMHEDDHRYT